MSRFEKAKERLKSKPKDYTYTEARSLLMYLGFEEFTKGKTSGSRVMFYRERDKVAILLHKPHPEDEMKLGAVKALAQKLIEMGGIIMSANNYLEYKGYHAKIEFDASDMLLTGVVDGINDLVCFHAENAAEVEAEFHSAVDDYLAFCAELGKAPDKEYKGSFNVRVSPELHRKADIAAKKSGISLNQFVQKAIEDEVAGSGLAFA